MGFLLCKSSQSVVIVVQCFCYNCNACSAVFWLGDLNYRLDNIDIEECKKKISEGQLDDLWRNNDQVLYFKSCLVILILCTSESVEIVTCLC